MTLYLLCGKSFAGKSTLASAIARETGATIVSLDAINAERGLLGGLGVPDHEWGLSHRFALQRTEELLSSGGSVVVDDTNCFRFLRDDYRALAQRLDHDLQLLYLDVSEETLRARMLANAAAPTRSQVGDAVFDELVSKFEPPGSDEHPIPVPDNVDPQSVLRRLLG